MEQYLPLIIGFLVLAFRIYSNFRKEQEKVRNRNMGGPGHAPGQGKERKEPARPQPYLPDVEDVFIPSRPYEPTYVPAKPEHYVREKVQEPRYEPMKAPKPITPDGRSPETASEEVLTNRAIHARHTHKFAPHEDEVERSAYADLNMEDAVIKSAILNRPEY